MKDAHYIVKNTLRENNPTLELRMNLILICF